MAMDGISARMIAQADAREDAGPAGIFLHAGWRSCGTWIWERLRKNARVQAFYEPLHEDLARLRARDIGLLRPDSWQSGHGTGAPYFAEYMPLLGARGGVHDHNARFAYDDYFRPPWQDDAALEHYLRSLVANAASEGRVPVLKFCRSLGRVPWLEARFPDMLHVVILRGPQAQWRSARRQMEQNGNRYFIVAPFVILARNAGNPLLANAAEWLGVKRPPGLGLTRTRDLSITSDACWRHVSRLSWQERFRGFLALWVASGVTSLQGVATLIDADRLAGEPQIRHAAEAALARVAGLVADLTPGAAQTGEIGDGDCDCGDAAAAMQDALSYLRAHSTVLPEVRAAILAAKLETGKLGMETINPRPAPRPGRLAYVDALAYVAIMRASYPLRRAHFHLRQWLGGEARPN